MSISVRCPDCQKKLKARDDLAGKRIKCPGCGRTLVVHGVDPSSQPEVPSPLPRSHPRATEAEPHAGAPASPAGRRLWPWIAGGAAVAVCLIGAAVLLITPGGKGGGTDVLAPGGRITKKALIGEWEGTREDGSILVLNFTDKLVLVSILAPGIDREKVRKAADWVSGSPYRSLGGGLGIGNVGYAIDNETNEIKLGGGEWAAVAKPATGGALVVAGQFKMSNTVYNVPATRIERVKHPDGSPPPARKDGGKDVLTLGGRINRDAVIGEWEGSVKDGTTVVLLFTDKLVAVSILAPGTNREKAREAAEYVSGDFGRALGGGGFGIGSTAYEIDAEKNEIKIWGTNKWAGVAKPTKDGALLVSGDLKIGTVPEIRLERVKRPGGNPPPQGGAPPQAGDVAELLRKGGKLWSSVEEANWADKQLKAGRSLWIRPAADMVFVAENGQLKIPLLWKVRSDGPAAGGPLGAELAGTGPGTAFRSYAPIQGIDLKAGEGTVEVTFSFRQKGEGELIVYLVAAGKTPVSNLLRLKARASP